MTLIFFFFGVGWHFSIRIKIKSVHEVVYLTNWQNVVCVYRRVRIKRPWTGNLRMQRKRGVGA